MYVVCTYTLYIRIYVCMSSWSCEWLAIIEYSE